MDENKSSISQARSYREIGEFWDTHDLTDYWEQTEPVEFEVDIQSEVRYYALESNVVRHSSSARATTWASWSRSTGFRTQPTTPADFNSSPPSSSG